MSKKPPNRPGITFEVGARIEAQDYLQKWYSSRIEEIDYDEGKMLVHFDRWSHRYDEWIAWDSTRLRSLERPSLRKEGLKEEEGEMTERLSEMSASRLDELPGCTESTEDQTELPQPRQELRDGEEVLARWTDCRYYPAKIESVNKEGTYTVQFYDGVIRCVKRIHIKSMPDDAKGQDWIALVKAASAAANSKGNNKPRTSANSNKERDEAPRGRSDDEEDADEEPDNGEQSDSDRLDGMDSDDDEKDAKVSSEQRDVLRSSRKRSRQEISLRNHKRARASKTTGSNQDDSHCQEVQTDSPVVSQQQKVPAAADESMQGQSQGQPGSFVTGSPAKCRNRRLKHPSGESSSSQNQKQSSRQPSFVATLSTGEDTMSAPESMLSPSASPRHSCPDVAPSGHGEAVPPASPRSPERNQRRRRSQRLATVSSDVTSDPTVTASPAHCPDSSPHGHGNDQNNPPTEPSPTEDRVASSSERVESSTLHNYCAAVTPPTPPSSASILTTSHPPITHADQTTDGPLANVTPAGDKLPPLAAAPGVRTATRTSKLNKHTREPIMNTKRSEDPTSPSDLDHYKCKILGCAKAFRKAKLLDYHLKYYHNADKDLQDSEPTVSPDRGGRTRATSASMPNTTHLEVPDSAKRRRTVSTSSSMSPQTHVFQLDCAGPPRFNRKKRSSASISSDSTELSLPPPSRDFEALHDKILKKVIDKDKHLEPGLVKMEKKVKLEGKCLIGKKKDKDKERRDRKDKDPFKIKQKKKKKKKKSKQHCYSDYDNVTLSFLERSQSSPLHRASAFTFLPSSSATSSSQRYQYPRAILSVDLTGENLSDIDFLEDSTTESLLLSGDEYNQEFDSLTMEDFQEEDDGSQEIVRCICEMDEENGFMIQCEECMCWQHSVCMGLLEDSIPDQYICYICRDPPGQRWSAKYLHDREWLNKGHMYGLSFVTENYSQQNSEKIVSTHQLLADVFSVNKILNGLQLKMDILQNKHNPNLHFWARSWVNSDEDQPMGGLPDCIRFTDHLDDVSLDNHNSSNPDTYITSEHSYQKPPCLGQLDHWSAADRAAPDLHGSTRPEGGAGTEPLGANVNQASDSIQFTPMEEEKETALAVSGCLNESGPDAVEHARNCLQWQMNLLTHIEDVQNQVAGRMDLIEKELDVLESWLDFTGELEPPDPLARLPQLKHRIKQLLTDLSKVQQMSALCSV
ncbi:PHD finger protein 20-like protein 1 isoform X2 [Esox lucius]|uniref:C2H2-type domain-containing protein n=1 Tax=Esox lucius TaxID=8010 RepID=A0A3P8Z255_ESOLU|nr:PHD finger protein 20-like protein 1 isoform X2 [Esox lucius]